MCCILPPGRSREGGRTRQGVNNTRSRLGKASVRVVANAEEVWEENRTERAKKSIGDRPDGAKVNK